jgi:hypothetical protein
MALELYALILVVVKRLPVALSIPLAVIYAIIVFPVQLMLMVLDFFLPHFAGNGLLIVAEKNNQSSKELLQ